MKLPRLAAVFGTAAALLAGAVAAPAQAQGQFDRPKYASIVVDANSGEVLYALRADQPRYPASITKVMTLYLTFEALATGRLSLSEPLTVSREAAGQAPSKLGLREGESITVRDAIQAVAVKSANDMAVVLAERLAGSQGKFAQLMTLRAQELGMAHTRFYNANGLPDARQLSTARDIAIMSRAVMRDYPQYYPFFSQKAFVWHGQTILNHNRLLLRMGGMDGLKTGYTNAAGFNLAASAVRDNRRLITVVLGGSSTAARDENVETLLTAGFDVLNKRSRGEKMTLASLLSEPDDNSGPILRPATEMGSGEQSGLQVVMGKDGPTVGAPAMQVARADLPPPPPVRMAPAVLRAVAPVRTAQACETVTVRRHHRRVHERVCHTVEATQVASAASAPDCRKLRGRKLTSCRAEARREQTQVAKVEALASADCHGLRGRKLSACRNEARAVARDVATAPTAADCAHVKGRRSRAACRSDASEAAKIVAKAEAASPASADCSKARTRRAKAACRTEAKAESKAETRAEAKAVGAKAAGGAFTVQVGAFGSRSDAQAHLAKLQRAHAALFGGASEQVESAGKHYRARFAGLSQADAKSACKSLAAKGERCMVVSR